MGQCAPVTVMTFSPIDQPNTIVMRCNSRLQGVSRFSGKGLTGHVITCEFRCIDADQAHFSTIFEMNGIAIVHVFNPGRLIHLFGRAGCLSMC